MSRKHAEARVTTRSDTRTVPGAAAPRAVPKMKQKEYEHELRRLHGELVAMQEWVKAHRREGLHRVRGPRHRRQGRHDQGDHRAGEPAGVPRRRAARADRAREVADVRPALHPALPRRRRGRDLRPQLVQPRRRRAGHGLLHRGAGRSASSSMVPAVEKAMVDSGIILVKYWLEVSPDEQTRRLESRIDDPRKIWKLSDMDLESYTRWDDYSRARDEHVRGDRHGVGAVVRRALRRQEAGPAQHHHPPARARSRTSRSSRTNHAAEAHDPTRTTRLPEDLPPARPRAVLSSSLRDARVGGADPADRE